MKQYKVYIDGLLQPIVIAASDKTEAGLLAVQEWGSLEMIQGIDEIPEQD